MPPGLKNSGNNVLGEKNRHIRWYNVSLVEQISNHMLCPRVHSSCLFPPHRHFSMLDQASHPWCSCHTATLCFPAFEITPRNILMLNDIHHQHNYRLNRKKWNCIYLTENKTTFKKKKTVCFQVKLSVNWLNNSCWKIDFGTAVWFTAREMIASFYFCTWEVRTQNALQHRNQYWDGVADSAMMVSNVM